MLKTPQIFQDVRGRQTLIAFALRLLTVWFYNDTMGYGVEANGDL